MGLSGRKVKQRISADPRNLSWADDAARFGSNYLSKFGWDASKGLGAGGDGMKSHIKVSHKLDMLGIGAAQMKDPNGIAWKQNTDFENLLRRLNENMPPQEAAQDEPSADKADSEDGEKKKKKRKHKDKDEEGGPEKKKKKEKESKVEHVADATPQPALVQLREVVETKTLSIELQKVVALPRHRAHRARAIAAKNIASKSSAHISEILGVAPDPQAAVPIEALKGKLTSVTETDALGMDKITTSTKSLADYFKEKLVARNGGMNSGTDTPSSTTTTTTTTSEDAYERPRTGIGASRMRLEIQAEDRIEEETQRVGLSKFSSLMSSSFLAATSSMTAYIPPKREETGGATDEDVISESETKKHAKDKKKDKKSSKVSEEENVEKTKKKKLRKDKKGKRKETEEAGEPSLESEDDRPAKREKKESAISLGTKEDDTEKPSHKKEKRKHKSETNGSEAGKSKREKKRRWTDS